MNFLLSNMILAVGLSWYFNTSYLQAFTVAVVIGGIMATLNVVLSRFSKVFRYPW